LHSHLKCFCLALIACVFYAGCGSSKPEVDAVSKTVIDKLSRKDWRGIFAMASDAEKKNMGIDQEQYVRVSEIIAEGFPENLSCKAYDIFKPTKTECTYAIKMMALPEVAPDLKVQSPLLALEFRLIEGQWYPLVSSLPMQLSIFQKESTDARHRRLLRAMVDSRVPWLIMNKRKLKIEDQRLVVAGKLDQMAAFR
jgi:hypothetical protein